VPRSHTCTTGPGPDQVKASPLRKQLLDPRLILDLNAFAYEDLGPWS
jgi:hypothetical protein